MDLRVECFLHQQEESHQSNLWNRSDTDNSPILEWQFSNSVIYGGSLHVFIKYVHHILQITIKRQSVTTFLICKYAWHRGGPLESITISYVWMMCHKENLEIHVILYQQRISCKKRCYFHLDGKMPCCRRAALGQIFSLQLWILWLCLFFLTPHLQFFFLGK